MNNRNLRELEMKILIIRMKTSVENTEDKSEAISQKHSAKLPKTKQNGTKNTSFQDIQYSSNQSSRNRN